LVGQFVGTGEADDVTLAEFPWITRRLREGHVVCFSRAHELPDEAATDRSTILAFGTKSVALVPFIIGGAAAGALAVSMLRVEREWPEELVQRLRLLAEMFAIVLMSRHAETALEESENRFRLMADAAPVMIWMAGPEGAASTSTARGSSSPEGRWSRSGVTAGSRVSIPTTARKA